MSGKTLKCVIRYLWVGLTNLHHWCERGKFYQTDRVDSLLQFQKEAEISNDQQFTI